MAGVGQLLRETREAKGLTLEQVERETRIRRAYLEALEREDFACLPGDVYARGFLRIYARFLKLDEAEILAQLTTAQSPSLRAGEVLSRSSSRLETRDVPLTPRPSRLGLSISLAFLSLALLFVGGYWGYRTYFSSNEWPWPFQRASWAPATATPSLSATLTTPEPPTSPPQGIASLPTQSPTALLVHVATPEETESPTDTVSPTPTGTQTPTVTWTPTPTATPSPTRTPTPKIYRGVEVAIAIRERSWLQVTVDGVRVFEGILEEGDTRTWEGMTSVALRVGNAGGVIVKLNGEILGPLGASGQVLDIEWVKADGGVIRNPTDRGPVADLEETEEEYPVPAIAGRPTPPISEQIPG